MVPYSKCWRSDRVAAIVRPFVAERCRYKSFAMGRVIRDKFSRKSKGFGFVSFMDFKDAAAALREMHGMSAWHMHVFSDCKLFCALENEVLSCRTGCFIANDVAYSPLCGLVISQKLFMHFRKMWSYRVHATPSVLSRGYDAGFPRLWHRICANKCHDIN